MLNGDHFPKIARGFIVRQLEVWLELKNHHVQQSVKSPDNIHGINICSIPAGLSKKKYIGGPRLDWP